MNKEIKIRPEQENDFQAVREVVELAFRDVEDSDQSEPYLVERLRKTDAYIPELSLVAELNGEIIGHLMMSKVEIVSEDQSVISLGLAPVSVVPKYQRIGVGSALIREAHKRAGELGYKSAVLLGHKDYYPRFGYKRAIVSALSSHSMSPANIAWLFELAPEGLKNVHGMIKYANLLWSENWTGNEMRRTYPISFHQII